MTVLPLVFRMQYKYVHESLGELKFRQNGKVKKMLSKGNPKNGDNLSILGYGCMRFPTKAGRIDEDRAIKLIHTAIEGGINYFDTAYIYNGGQSEVVLGKALAGDYRDKVKIATKLPYYMVHRPETAKKIFNTQLDRLKTDRIDYYLLHMLSDLSSFSKMKDLGVMDYLENLKASGTIGNIGFSFHGGKADFEEIIKAYPWDFCQIQYNYMDENFQATKSGLKLAAAMGIPVVIMEPLRGGKLTDKLPKEAVATFRKADPNRSMAEWGLRWVWNHPEVNLLLSGMSDEEQLEENLRIASSSRENSLSKEDLEVFEKVKSKILGKTKIPCTACGYCMPCPYGVNIPGCFSIYNDKYLTGGGPTSSLWKYAQTLGGLSKETAFASRCTKCGKCEPHCPQGIKVRDELAKISKEIEGPLFNLALKIGRNFVRVKKR